ncbi:hypothetical protein [Labrenzia sp. VG12]|uniref:hypothetical protein n=1 Tax=Labrenzia sp. VG12 TaxID=2021862 RepID=UPI0012FD61C1|nr:hypothetical protein [Labrenzia sp. VG12]
MTDFGDFKLIFAPSTRPIAASIFVASFTLFLLAPTGFTFSEANESLASSSCPTAWLSIIEEVATVGVTLPKDKNVILFSGPDGRVFNCLDAKISMADFEAVSAYQSGLTLAMAQRRLEDPSTDTGYCDYGSFPHPTATIHYMINLPYEGSELRSEKCSNRLRTYLKFLSEKK